MKKHKKFLPVILAMMCSLIVGCADSTEDLPATSSIKVETDSNLIIDNIKISESRKIQENLYYYSLTNDYSLYDKNNFEETVKTVYSEFESLFGVSPLNDNPLLITLDPDEEIPNTNFLGDGFRIRTLYRSINGEDGIDKTGMFSSIVVYELSHEMTHYFINSKYGMETNSEWNEEIIAEATALYMLNRLDGKVYDSGFPLSTLLESRLTNSYPDDAINLANLKYENISDEKFAEFSKEVKNMWNPEVRHLYNMLLKYSDSDIRNIMNIYDYFNAENESIDYAKWEQDLGEGSASKFISVLSTIQPKLKSD